MPQEAVTSGTAAVAGRDAGIRAPHEMENHAIFDAAMVGILVTSGGVIQRCNDSLERMFGYARGELHGVSPGMLYADEGERDRAAAASEHAFAEQGHYTAEQRMRRKDGTLIRCSISARAIDAGRPGEGVISVVEDVTARREAEDALRAGVAALREREDALVRAGAELAASSARLHEAIEAVPDGFALFDAHDRLVLCNQRYKDLYLSDARGGSPVGMSFEQLLRASLAPGGTGTLPASHANDLEGWVAERLLRHRNPAPEG
jgi:PAS domain S-box-containing protein